MSCRALRAAAIALLFVPGFAEAQYFGRNRVQYEEFDFKVLQTTHFDVYYYPEEREAVEMAARMAERWYARLSAILGHELSTRQPLIIYAAHPHFRQTNVLPSEPGVGTGGVTELLKRRIVLPLAGALSETDHVIGHELVHAFQFDITTGQGGAAAGGVPGAVLLPLWFVEGMAEYLSLGPVDPHTTMWIRGAILGDNLPGLDDLANPANSPYRFGHALWAYIGGRWGDKAVGDMLRVGGASGVEAAIREVLKVEPEELIEAWHEASSEAFEAVSRNTDPPSAVGRRILAEETSRGDLNIAPSISPDGSRVVFLSTRELFSLDLYVADVETGRVERKLVDTAGDQHFDNLEFIESSGSWSPDGRRFVLAAVRAGQPVLSIFDVDRGKAERDVVFTGLDEVFNPAWSPDGTRLAFTGAANGFLDLYVHDLSSAKTARLTNDAYAELQPAWSPDGGRLAFATDRFSTDLESLQAGDFELATIRVSGGNIERLPGFSNARHINPEWTADGRSIFFLADPSGVTNIFRLDLQTGRIAQLTDVVTGVSGITSLSPSLSVARGVPRIVFSAHGRENVLNVYQIDTEEALRGRDAGSPRRLAAAAIRRWRTG